MLRFKEFNCNYNWSYIAWGNATLYTGNVCWTWTVYGAVLFGGCAQCDCSEQALGCLPLILHFINDRYYLPNIILVFFQEILHSLALKRPLKDISFLRLGIHGSEESWSNLVKILVRNSVVVARFLVILFLTHWRWLKLQYDHDFHAVGACLASVLSQP